MMQAKSVTVLTVILSEDGSVNENYIRSAKVAGDVCVIHPPGTAAAKMDGVQYFPVEKSLPAALNEIAFATGADFLLVMPDNVKLAGNFNQLVSSADENCGLLCCDYFADSEGKLLFQPAYEGPEDITERADLGPVLIYRINALKKIGGWDESLKYAFDYDLRLRMMESYASRRIQSPLYTIFPEPAEAAAADAAQKLFFPGKGKYGGFSYLFMDKEEEAEIELVFVNCLKRRGAYLEGEAPPMLPEPKITPLVSVITPVYNRAKFIGQAIESVTGGKFEDFEYIIIDNGSTDNTREVVREYAANDKRIRLIENDVNRIAYSLNLGVDNACGKYISQLDSDDLYTPDTLQSLVNFMEETNCGLGISYYSLIDEDGNDLPEFGIIKHLEYSRNNILRVDGAGAARMWRKSAIEELGGFDAEDLVDYGEDYDLYVKLGEKYLIGRVHEVLYKYRRHPDNSDILRDPMFKLRNKNLARERALARRKRMNRG